jgi:hypothetical protein
MVDRGFTELELRLMMNRAGSLRRDVVPGRWVAVTRHRKRRWEVVIEPDDDAQRIVVITAYPVWESLS